MLTTDAVKYFGSKEKLARPLAKTQLSAWGRLVPEVKQLVYH
jgi:hypothetical protein